MFDKNIFKLNLRNLRFKKNITLQELGYKIQVSKQTISSWELGTRIPPINKLVQLAEYFDVSTDYLLGRTDNPNSHKK